MGDIAYNRGLSASYDTYLDAICASYGCSEDEAACFFSESDNDALEEILDGWRGQARSSFYFD